MLQAAGRLRLAVETLEQSRIVSHSGCNRLQRDKPIDHRIARAVNDSHRAATQLSEKLVFAQIFQRRLRPFRQILSG
jgi:hypothetical protein